MSVTQTETQLLALLPGDQPATLMLQNLLRTMFAQHEAVTSGAAAATGAIGEILTATLASGSATALTTNTAKTVTSVALTAGVWEVTGVVGYLPDTLTSVTYMEQGLSATTNVVGGLGTMSAQALAAVVPGVTAVPVIQIPRVTLNLAATTTYYLIAKALFTVSTLSAYGTISALRIR